MEDLSPDNAVKALAVFTAIPVVLFALWAEYFGQYVEEIARAKSEKINRAVELRALRTAGVFAALLQVLIFLAGRASLENRPLFCAGLFFVAILFQLRTQAVLERRIRVATGEPAAPEKTATSAERFRLGIRSLSWVGLNMVLYWAALFGSLRFFLWLARALHVTDAAGAALILCGAALGIFAGLGLNFAIAPIHLRRMLPVTRVTDESARTKLAACFARAGLKTPDLWVIEADRFRWTNAMIAGFRSGRGWFAPGLFVTRSLFTDFSPNELEAVVLHEVSHVALNHASRRFLYGFFVVLGATLGAGLIFMSSMLIPQSDLGTLLKIASLALPLALPMVLIRRQARRHELEADTNAVVGLGADADALSEALRKLDRMNDPMGGQSATHPSTEERILRLRALVLRAETRGADTHEHKKAA